MKAMKHTQSSERRFWRSWPGLLIGGGVVLAALNIYAFYPGFLSNDSVDQLTQALGDKPLEDWHPPLMAVTWRLLMVLFGRHPGIMLVWQALLLWAALTVLALYVYKQTERRWLSLLPLGLGITPFVITISGVIWKDVQMAVALLVATVILLYAGKLSTGRKKYSLLALSAVAMVYAINMRYNAVAAVLPLLWLMWWQLPERSVRVYNRTVDWLRLSLVAGVIVAALILVPILSLFKPVTATHPISSQMLDDVLHIYSTQRIEQLHIQPDAKRALVSVSHRCQNVSTQTSLWISCATADEFHLLSREQYPALRSVWLSAVSHHPVSYGSYRVGQFWGYLTPSNAGEAFIWQDGTVQNPYGLKFRPNWVIARVSDYVGFMHFDFGFIFRPYTWLLVGIALIVAAQRRRQSWQHAREIVAIAASGVLYIIAYLPAVAAYDFRYSYWACLAISVAAILAVIDSRIRATQL